MRTMTRGAGRWLALLAACGLAFAAHAQGGATTTLPLWPEGHLPRVVQGPEQVGGDGSAAGAVRNVSEPRLEIHRAAVPGGGAALIVGGGGYFRIQVGSAARPMAQWLSAIGVTSAVLVYRLPGDGWPAEAPFQDVQRALRLLRAHAAELGIDPEKIGVIGSSAGANAAGIVATRWDHDFYPKVDAADAGSARPAFLAMLYPVVSMQSGLDRTRSARELSTQPGYREAYSVERHVRRDMPPVFLAQAVDDPIVDIRHSLAMYQAALEARVPVELHAFDSGGHSWGLGAPGSGVGQWPGLFANWARRHGWLGAMPPAVPGSAGASAPVPAAAQDAGGEDAVPEEDGDDGD